MDKSLPQVDEKYMSGLSTILVATIEEAKDRISQIEYIFCSQLYPNFQKNSKCFQKLYSEARRVALEECKERELKLLTRITELEEKLLHKTKEVDKGTDLHAKLLALIDSKASIISTKDRQIRELEERIHALNKELHDKDDELSKGNERRAELLTQIESQALKITSGENMLINTEKEKKQLALELDNMRASFDGLRAELKRKSVEVDEGNKAREQLVEQVNLSGIELTRKDQQLSALEREKNLHLSRIQDLENKVKVLEENLRNANSMVVKKSQYQNDFVQQIELKNAELAAERQKYKDLTTAYKKLKSQYTFLLTKVPNNKEEMLPPVKLEGESDPSSHGSKRDTPPEIRKTAPVHNVAVGEVIKVKKEIGSVENSDDEKGGRPNQLRSSHPPLSSTSNSPAATNWITNRSSGSSTGTKRPATGWRETRSRQSPGGPDPHDDFLDTPYENIRGNLDKALKDKLHDNPAHVSEDMDFDTSDDETQDMQAEPGSKKQQLQAPRLGQKSFKYVEPVRKKSERENLNGIECKQCKKFYDAVLSDAVGKDGEVDKRNFRCEHHEGVSRHRYRYVPPMTPEGFWNIGFDSET